MTIVITGSSKGIGKYLYDRYSQKGIQVFGTFNTTSHPNTDNNRHKVDISAYAEVVEWIDKIKAELTEIVLINCAGINYNSYAHRADIEQWNRVIDVNIKGTFNVIRAILPIMREQNYGRIINFSSVVAKLPTPGISAYSTSKSALIGMTKTLAVENASKGITVNAINQGYANLGMGINNVPKEYQQKMKATIPSARFCEPEEIFNTVEYLINTSYVNGASIDINGGII